MSIENLKKILESERRVDSKLHSEIECGNDNAEKSYKCGSNDMENRLLPLLQKAVEMAEWYSDGLYPNDVSEFNGALRNGKKAREFLAEFTKMTEIKKESM